MTIMIGVTTRVSHSQSSKAQSGIFSSSSSRVIRFDSTQPAKTAVSSPPIGSMMLEATNSIAPMMSLPPIVTSDQMFRPNTDSSPTSQVSAATASAICLREKLVASTKYAVGGSSSEIELVQAATESRRKNAMPYAMPKGISLKASGNAVKMKPAPPPSGSSPNDSTMGKMARPATSATAVSANATATPTLGTLTCDGR